MTFVPGCREQEKMRTREECKKVNLDARKPCPPYRYGEIGAEEEVMDKMIMVYLNAIVQSGSLEGRYADLIRSRDGMPLADEWTVGGITHRDTHELLQCFLLSHSVCLRYWTTRVLHRGAWRQRRGGGR